MGREWEKPRFTCGYQGVTDYEWRGKKYAVRSGAEDWRPGVWNYTPEEYAKQVVAFVGTVTGPWGSFPPAELVAFFPGYVGAKYNPVTKTADYDGAAPETVHSGLYGTLSKPWADEMRGYGWTLEPIVAEAK